jgi:hypothetical protein
MMVGSIGRLSMPRLKQVTVFHEVVADMIKSEGSKLGSFIGASRTLLLTDWTV